MATGITGSSTDDSADADDPGALPPGAVDSADGQLVEVEGERDAGGSANLDTPDTAMQAGMPPPPLPPPSEPPRSDRKDCMTRLRECAARLPSMSSMSCLSLPSMPTLDMVDLLRRTPPWYCKTIGKYPLPALTAYSLVFIIVIVSLWSPVMVGTDLNAFRQVDSQTSTYFNVYLEALKHRRAVRNKTSLGDRDVFELEIFYRSKDGGSVFSEAGLRDIRAFEHELRDLPGWKKLCNMSDERAKFRCEPGESFGNYIWPKRLEDDLDNTGYYKLEFRGRAREQFPVPAVLTMLAEGATAPHSAEKFLPLAFHENAGSTSEVMRSLFTFTAPGLSSDGFRELYEAFVSEELYPVLQAALAKSREAPDPTSWDDPMRVEIFFRGDVVDDHEVKIVLGSDMQLAIGALIIAWLILWLQLHSLFLATLGTLSLVFGCLATYAVLQVEELGLASFLSVFIVLGLGSNILIVVDDSFRRSRRELSAFPAERLLSFGRSTLWLIVPVLFTGCSYYVHLAANIRPIREFGLFVGSALIFVCLAILTLFVPTLLLHEEYVRGFVHDKCKAKVAMVLEPRKMRPPWKKITALCMRLALKGKKTILGFLAVAALLLIITGSVAGTGERTGLPEVFPSTHPRSAGRPLQDRFSRASRTDTPAPEEMTICEPGRTPGGSECSLHWCEAPVATGQAPNSSVPRTCTCYKDVDAQTSCATREVRAFIAGAGDVLETSQLRSVKDFVKAEWNQNLAAAATPVTKQASLVLEHWESGATDIETVVKMPLRLSTSGGSAACKDELVCYCGPRVCQLPAGYRTCSRRLTVDPTADSRRLATSASDLSRRIDANRRLQASTASAEVVVVYGIVPPASLSYLDGGLQTITYENRFDPKSPWSQRALLAMCAGKPGVGLPTALKVLQTSCWINDFKAWLGSQGKRFPVHRFGDFHAELKHFLSSHKAASASMWLDAEGKLRATSLHFKIRLASSSYEIIDDQNVWLEHVNELNKAAHTTANDAWPAAQAWVDAEAEVSALGSAWSLAALVLLATTISGLLYTRDIAAVSVILVVAVVICTFLAFVMFCLYNWAVGPWEVIVLTVFLSFSAEPAFRMFADYIIKGDEVSSANLGRADESQAAESSDGALGGALADGTADDKPEPEPPVPAAAAALEEEAAPATAELEDRPHMQEIVADGEVDAAGAGEGDSVATSGTGVEPQEDRELQEARVRRALYLVSEYTLAGGLKIFLSGILLLPCQVQLFSRLGAVAVAIPFCTIPCILVLLPAVILTFFPTHKTPDCVLLFRYITTKVSNFFWS